MHQKDKKLVRDIFQSCRELLQTKRKQINDPNNGTVSTTIDQILSTQNSSLDDNSRKNRYLNIIEEKLNEWEFQVDGTRNPSLFVLKKKADWFEHLIEHTIERIGPQRTFLISFEELDNAATNIDSSNFSAPIPLDDLTSVLYIEKHLGAPNYISSGLLKNKVHGLVLMKTKLNFTQPIIAELFSMGHKIFKAPDTEIH
jgi:hypothetical protein